LKLLDADGLIEINMHRGAVVSAYRPEDAMALFDVIAMLESLAARRFCENISATSLQKLEDLHGTMLTHHAAGRTNDYFDTNTLIHDAIVRAADNPVLKSTHQKLMIRARRGRFLAIMDPDRLEQALSEHEKLMVALRENDPDAAAAVWEMHLRHTGQTVATVSTEDS
jgi:DNA-binding GntR family transcriptional regulator